MTLIVWDGTKVATDPPVGAVTFALNARGVDVAVDVVVRVVRSAGR